MSEEIHRIRLQGPWDVIAPGESEFVKTQIPVDWKTAFSDIAGTATFRRNFHAPTGLEPGQNVVIALPEGAGMVSNFTINGTPIELDSSGLMRFEIHSFLEPFNEICLDLTFDPAESPESLGGLWEAVTLEIHPKS